MRPPPLVQASKIASGAPRVVCLEVKNQQSITKLNLFFKFVIGILEKLIMRQPLGFRLFAKAVYAECGIKPTESSLCGLLVKLQPPGAWYK